MATIKLLSSILLNQVYPIGSIYMSVNNSSPASFLGGTWQRIQGRFLYGVVDNNTTYAVNKEGGEVNHILNTNEMPKHSHVFVNGSGYEIKPAVMAVGPSGGHELVQVSEGQRAYENLKLQSTGENQSHNNMPPYLCVYMWKRTA